MTLDELKKLKESKTFIGNFFISQNLFQILEIGDEKVKILMFAKSTKRVKNPTIIDVWTFSKWIEFEKIESVLKDFDREVYFPASDESIKRFFEL